MSKNIRLLMIFLQSLQILKALKFFAKPEILRSQPYAPDLDIFQYCLPINEQETLSYYKLPQLGQGAFGSVKEYLDNSVVKVQNVPLNNNDDEKLGSLKQIQLEIYFLSEIQKLLVKDDQARELQNHFLKIEQCKVYKDIINKKYHIFLQLPRYYCDLNYQVKDADSKSLTIINYLKHTQDINIKKQRFLQMAVEYFQQLAFLHRNKIIHGDIKPDNLLVKIDRNIQQMKYEIQSQNSINRDIEISYTLSDYGLTTYEYSQATNFNKKFSHPVLYILFENKITAYRQADVYSMALSLLTIMKYQLNVVDSSYYIKYIAKYLEKDKQYTKDQYEQHLYDGLLDMTYYIRTDYNLNPKIVDFTTCLDLECILFSLLKVDITSIPNSWHVLLYLQKILNFTKFNIQFQQNLSLFLKDRLYYDHTITRIKKRCPSLDKIDFQETEFFNIKTFIYKCQLTTSKNNKKYASFDYFPKDKNVNEFFVYISGKGQVENWLWAFQIYFKNMLIMKNFVNMDYEYYVNYQDPYQQQITENDHMYVFNYYYLNFMDQNHESLQQQIELDEFVVFPMNFINLFKGLSILHDNFLVLQNIDPKTVVQTVYFEKLSHLKLKMIPLPVFQANRMLNSTRQPLFFSYPLTRFDIFPYQADIYSLAVTCLYVMYKIYTNKIENQDIFQELSKPIYRLSADIHIRNVRDSFLNTHQKLFKRSLNFEIENCMELQQFPDNLAYIRK